MYAATMLRLKPSKISLAPADVEETCRRMEQSKVANPPANLPTRIRGSPVSPGYGPRLRHGLERSWDDAVANLGHVPIPMPQEVIHTSVHNLDNGYLRQADSPTEDGKIAFGDSSTPSPDIRTQVEPSAAPTGLLGPPQAISLQLPFRRTLREGESLDGPSSTEAPSENSSSSLPKQHLTTSRFRQERTNSSEDGNTSLLWPRIHAFTDGQVEPADTHETPRRPRGRSLRQHSSHASSPLQQMQKLSPPRQRRVSDTSAHGPET